MKIDFSYRIMVDIWSDYIDEEMILIPANLSDELREAIRKEIITNANKREYIHVLEDMKKNIEINKE